MNLTRTRKNCLTRKSWSYSRNLRTKNSNCWRTTNWKKNCWNCSRKSWKTERCWRKLESRAPRNCCGNWKTTSCWKKMTRKNSNCWKTTNWKKKAARCWRNPEAREPKNSAGNWMKTKSCWKTNCSRRRSWNCCWAWDQTQTNLLPPPNCSTSPLLPSPGTG